nr:MAG TPA: AAA domain protein [Caudoviricetes sp.]
MSVKPEIQYVFASGHNNYLTPETGNRRFCAIATDAETGNKGLIFELIAAHRILQAVLSIMTTRQKIELGRKVQAMGFGDEGVTRAHERLAVLNDAGVLLAHLAAPNVISSKPIRPARYEYIDARVYKHGLLPEGAIVIYSPQGGGKTRRSAELLAHFGKQHIIEEWIPGMEIPADAIALTNVKVPGCLPFPRIKAQITEPKGSR